MLTIWSYTLVSVFLVSFISLIGVFTLALKPELLRKLLFFMVSFAVGGILGGAFIHLIPESVEEIGGITEVSLLVLAGILFFFILEKFVLWRHCHVPTSKDHPHPVVLMNIIGDGAHNLSDGLAIAASYLISIPVGIATTVAVILHEIPQEIGDFGVLVHGGLEPKKALLMNLLSGLFAVAGALFVLIFGAGIKEGIIFILPLAAGGFIYIAASDLIPSLHGQRDFPRAWLQLLFILLGIFVMLLLRH